MNIPDNYINNLFGKKEEKKAPTSERAFYIQQCADLTGMTWKVMFGKTMHLPTKWIKDLYDDAQSGRDQVGKSKLFWYLLKKTKDTTK